MPIALLLKDSLFSADLTRTVKVAIEMMPAGLHLPDSNHPVLILAAGSLSLRRAGSAIPTVYASRS
jgi:hypothetical protein